MRLPKKYKNEGGKYPQFVGYEKLSYSQYTSWIEDMYRAQYILQYMFGGPFTTNVWATFGSEVGEYIEARGLKDEPSSDQEIMTPECKEFLDTLDYPENCTYEDEIVVPVLDKDGNILFVIQGFIDRAEYKDKNVSIIDYKTGNIDKKKEFYGSEDYGQTTLYSHCKKLEGYKIKYSGVELLGRKGNGYAKHPIRLSGDVAIIPTPYTATRAKKLLKKMTAAAEEISFHYNVLLKLRKEV